MRSSALCLIPLIATAGNLISYGPDPINPFRRAAKYFDRILEGEKANLPAQTPTINALAINLKPPRRLASTCRLSVRARPAINRRGPSMPPAQIAAASQGRSAADIATSGTRDTNEGNARRNTDAGAATEQPGKHRWVN